MKIPTTAERVATTSSSPIKHEDSTANNVASTDACQAVTAEPTVAIVKTMQSSEVSTKRVAESCRSIDTAALLAAISAPIQKVPVATHYTISLVLAAIVMVALPLAYFGLILLTIWGVYYHAVYNRAMYLDERTSRGSTGMFVYYVVPIFMGCVLVFFLIKPLLARAGSTERRRSLSRSAEPRLHAFIDALCRAVHAPVPKRIDIDCQVNASASFRRGLLSMFGNDLVLTIGMPLVAGLNAREFAGVLAHEFGHFSQGFGMRLSYLIRTINMWFVRVVYQRDSWDELLERWSQQGDYRIALILQFTRLVVWASRRILWLLMMIGNAICCYLMRQMEYNADLHECRFSGSDAFVSTSHKLRYLSVAFEQAMADQHAFYLDGSLCNDQPELTNYNRLNQDPSLIQKIDAAGAEQKHHWMATHPLDRDRVAAAEREAAPGVFRLDIPASALFSKYREACEGVTQDMLHELLDKNYKPQMLVSFDQLIGKKQQTSDGRKAFMSIAGPHFNVPRPLGVASIPDDDARSVQQLFDQLKNSRKQMEQLQKHYLAASERFDKADTTWLQTHFAITFIELGAKLKQKDYEFPVGTLADALQSRSAQAKLLGSIGMELAAFERALVDRFQSAVGLLRAKQVIARVPDARGMHAVSLKAISSLAVLERHPIDMLKIRNLYATLMGVMRAIDGNDVGERVYTKLLEHAREICGLLNKLQQEIQPVYFPFAHADGEVLLANYLVPRQANAENLPEVAGVANSFLEQYNTLYFRCLGTLAHTCHNVEDVLGLPRQ